MTPSTHAHTHAHASHTTHASANARAARAAIAGAGAAAATASNVFSTQPTAASLSSGGSAVRAGRARVSGGGVVGVVAPLSADDDGVPAPSLLHPEGLPPGPSLRDSTRRLFADVGTRPHGGQSESDESEEDPDSAPSGYADYAKRHAISSAQDATAGLNRTQRMHAAAQAAAAASATAAAGAKGAPVRVPTASEAAQERAERLWSQRAKWSRLLRAAAELEDPVADAHASSSAQRRTGFVCYAKDHPQAVRRLISRGIPSVYRGFVWQQLSGSADPAWRAAMLQQQFQLGPQSHTHTHLHTTTTRTASASSSAAAADPSSRPFLSDLSPHGAYHRILGEHASSPLEEQIIKDLGRTFPKQAFFKDRSGMGQNSLFHVLKAYAFFDPPLGYCQGMGYIAAGLLQHMGEEDAFWLLVCLLHHPRYGGLRGLFLEGMPKLNSLFYLLEQVLSKDLPKLTAHFEHAGMHLSMFSSTWLMTLFAGAFTDFENVARIWDVLVWQGFWFLLKVSVGMLKHAEKSLLGCSFEHCLSHLKYLQSTIAADQLIEQSLLVSLDYAECERWQLDFEKEQRAREHAHAASSAHSSFGAHGGGGGGGGGGSHAHSGATTPTASTNPYSAWNQELSDEADDDDGADAAVERSASHSQG